MKPYKLLFILLLFFTACNMAAPLDYSVTPPDGWRMYDTVMLDRDVRILQGPDSTMGEVRPFVNIIVQPMNKKLPDFTQANMSYLKKHGEHVMIQQTGTVVVKGINASWFTYTNVHGGVERASVNYIIPVGDYGYMITCAVNAGHMDEYAQIFDDIVQSFYCIKPTEE